MRKETKTISMVAESTGLSVTNSTMHVLPVHKPFKFEYGSAYNKTVGGRWGVWPPSAKKCIFLVLKKRDVLKWKILLSFFEWGNIHLFCCYSGIFSSFQFPLYKIFFQRTFFLMSFSLSKFSGFKNICIWYFLCTINKQHNEYFFPRNFDLQKKG